MAESTTTTTTNYGILDDIVLDPIDVYQSDVATANPTGYDATLQDPNNVPQVNANTWDGNLAGNVTTLEDRLTGLLNKDSDYMQLARTNALQSMNKRGLLNSSMAVGASQAAAIAAGLPIAQQDASAFNQYGLADQASLNRADSENANALNQSDTFNATTLNQANQLNQQYGNQASQFNATAANDFALQNQDALNRSATDFASAKNEASIQDASNNLKLLLASAEESLSNYRTDIQRKTALDNIASGLVTSGLNAGIFATVEGGANWISMIGQLYPEMGLSVTSELADQASTTVV